MTFLALAWRGPVQRIQTHFPGCFIRNWLSGVAQFYSVKLKTSVKLKLERPSHLANGQPDSGALKDGFLESTIDLLCISRVHRGMQSP